MMMFSFPVADHKYLSSASLVQKFCLFKAKLNTKANSNMQNSMAVSILSVLD